MYFFNAATSHGRSLVYSNHPNTGLVRYSNGKTCSIVKWFGFQMASEIRTKKSGFRMIKHDLNTGTNTWLPDKTVRISNGFHIWHLNPAPSLGSALNMIYLQTKILATMPLIQINLILPFILITVQIESGT